MKYFSFLLIPFAALLDKPLVLWQRTISLEIDQLFSKITHLGKSEWILIPLGIYVIYYYRKSVIAYKTLYIWLCVAISGILVQPFKVAIGRARPSKFELEGVFSFKPFAFNSGYYSMPSGHATTALALSVALAILFPKYKVPLIIVGLFIAFTRIIVGAHYMSDIVAGGLIGTFTAIIISKHMFFKGKLT
jgi:membrane-associated phospholipid phosphatase